MEAIRNFRPLQSTYLKFFDKQFNKFKVFLAFIFIFVFSSWRITNFFEAKFFYAEDGAIFFTQAIQYGLKSIFMPYSHHLLIMRLLSFICVNISIEKSYLLFQIAGGATTSLCLAIFVSERYKWIIENNYLRFLICIFISCIHGFDSIFFTICNLYYPISCAIMLLLIPNKDNKWSFSIADSFVVSFLWLSCGFGIIFTPLLVYLYFCSKNKNYITSIITLIFSIILNFLSFSQLSVQGDAVIPGSAIEILFKISNVFLRTVYLNYIFLPLSGPKISIAFDNAPREFFVISCLIIFFLTCMNIKKIPHLIKDEKTIVLALICATGCLSKILVAVVREYGSVYSLHPIINLNSRYSVMLCFSCMLFWLWLIKSLTKKKTILIFSILLLCINLTTQQYFLYRSRADSVFENQWSEISAKIKKALEEKENGKLKEAVIIENIPCWPPEWRNNNNKLVINPY